MDDISVCISGYQSGGGDGRCPTTFPICVEAGGEDSLKQLIKAGQEYSQHSPLGQVPRIWLSHITVLLPPESRPSGGKLI